MRDVVAALDLHLEKTQGIVMSKDGRIVSQKRFPTTEKAFRNFLKDLPQGTRVTLESVGFCWPWIECIEEEGHVPILANPSKVKERASDVKTDKVDAELLAHMTRMDWLPECYVPPKGDQDAEVGIEAQGCAHEIRDCILQQGMV